MNAHDNFLPSNIRYLRELENKSKNQLSLIVKTSNTLIGQLERNEIASPSYKVVESLADYFGVYVRDLVRKDLTYLQDDLERQLVKLAINAAAFNERNSVATLKATVASYMEALVSIGHFDIRNR